MLSLSPLSRVFGADMSKNCGSFRFGNTLWLSPCRRLLSRCIRVCGRLRLAVLGTLRRQLRFPLLAGVCQSCSRSPSLLKTEYDFNQNQSRKILIQIKNPRIKKSRRKNGAIRAYPKPAAIRRRVGRRPKRTMAPCWNGIRTVAAWISKIPRTTES